MGPKLDYSKYTAGGSGLVGWLVLPLSSCFTVLSFPRLKARETTITPIKMKALALYYFMMYVVWISLKNPTSSVA